MLTTENLLDASRYAKASYRQALRKGIVPYGLAADDFAQECLVDVILYQNKAEKFGTVREFFNQIIRNKVRRLYAHFDKQRAKGVRRQGISSYGYWNMIINPCMKTDLLPGDDGLHTNSTTALYDIYTGEQGEPSRRTMEDLKEEACWLIDHAASMKPRERAVVKLYLDGLDYKASAEAMKVTPRCIHKLLKSGLTKLEKAAKDSLDKAQMENKDSAVHTDI